MEKRIKCEALKLTVLAALTVMSFNDVTAAYRQDSRGHSSKGAQVKAPVSPARPAPVVRVSTAPATPARSIVPVVSERRVANRSDTRTQVKAPVSSASPTPVIRVSNAPATPVSSTAPVVAERRIINRDATSAQVRTSVSPTSPAPVISTRNAPISNLSGVDSVTSQTWVKSIGHRTEGGKALLAQGEGETPVVTQGMRQRRDRRDVHRGHRRWHHDTPGWYNRFNWHNKPWGWWGWSGWPTAYASIYEITSYVAGSYLDSQNSSSWKVINNTGQEIRMKPVGESEVTISADSSMDVPHRFSFEFYLMPHSGKGFTGNTQHHTITIFDNEDGSLDIETS